MHKRLEQLCAAAKHARQLFAAAKHASQVAQSRESMVSRDGNSSEGFAEGSVQTTLYAVGATGHADRSHSHGSSQQTVPSASQHSHDTAETQPDLGSGSPPTGHTAGTAPQKESSRTGAQMVHDAQPGTESVLDPSYELEGLTDRPSYNQDMHGRSADDARTDTTPHGKGLTSNHHPGDDVSGPGHAAVPREVQLLRQVVAKCSALISAFPLRLDVPALCSLMTAAQRLGTNILWGTGRTFDTLVQEFLDQIGWANLLNLVSSMHTSTHA